MIIMLTDFFFNDIQYYYTKVPLESFLEYNDFSLNLNLK